MQVTSPLTRRGEQDHYHRIAYDASKLDQVLLEIFMGYPECARRPIILGLTQCQRSSSLPPWGHQKKPGAKVSQMPSVSDSEVLGPVELGWWPALS